MVKKKLPDKLEITELFLVKAGNDYRRTFVGQISREISTEGKNIVCGYVEVTDGRIWSSAETQQELGKFLDELCLMKLDMNLHSNSSEQFKNSDGFISSN